MTEAVVRGKAGMASVKDMPVVQDGPPPGGFAPVRYARRIPNTGPSAMAIFLAALGVFSFGMYQVGKGNKIRRYCLSHAHARIYRQTLCSLCEFMIKIVIKFMSWIDFCC